MGSSAKKKSEQELAAEAKSRQEIAASIQGRKKVITGGTTKGGSKNEYVGTEVIMDPDGKSFTFGASSDPSARFKWNEKTNDYRSNGGGILELADLAPVEQSSGGGGGGGGSEQQGSGQGLLAGYDQGNVVYNRGQGEGGLLGQGLTTDQIVGGLLPGQEEYIYQVNPNHQVAPDLGTYVLPDFRIV